MTRPKEIYQLYNQVSDGLGLSNSDAIKLFGWTAALEIKCAELEQRLPSNDIERKMQEAVDRNG